jgi:hypothetical protein
MVVVEEHPPPMMAVTKQPATMTPETNRGNEDMMVMARAS